jgi:hypothetical protein
MLRELPAPSTTTAAPSTTAAPIRRTVSTGVIAIGIGSTDSVPSG